MADASFSGKTALISGGASGIGLATTSAWCRWCDRLDHRHSGRTGRTGGRNRCHTIWMW